MKKMCIYTCITGDYDNLLEISNPEKDFDYYCFTNNTNLKSDTWKIIFIEDKKLDNHLLSRKIKMLGHPHLSKYDIWIWIDANIKIKKSVKKFIDTHCKLDDYDFVAFKHPSRDCIYDEAIACLKYRKDMKENLIRQVEFYREEGFPEHYGLCEMGIFFRKNNEETENVMKKWFQMLKKYSRRDQMSFMYIVYKTNLNLQQLPLIINNDYFEVVPHKKNEQIKTYRLYFGNSKEFSFDRVIDGEYERIENHYLIKTKIPVDTNVIEISITKKIGIRLSNVKINIPVDVRYCNAFYHEQYIMFDGECLGYMYGEFKKDEELIIQMDIEDVPLEYSLSAIRTLKKENEQLYNQLQTVVQSKGWQLLEKLRKLKIK